jgi:hypothetical protein
MKPEISPKMIHARIDIENLLVSCGRSSLIADFRPIGFTGYLGRYIRAHYRLVPVKTYCGPLNVSDI